MLYNVTDLSSPSEVASPPVNTQNSSSLTPGPPVPSDTQRLPSTTSEARGAASVPPQDLLAGQRDSEDPFMSPGSADSGKVVGNAGDSLADIGRSTVNLANSSSQQYQAGAKEPTPSIASDISNPYAAQELQQRLQQLQK